MLLFISPVIPKLVIKDYDGEENLVRCTIKLKIRNTLYTLAEFKEHIEEGNEGMKIKHIEFIRKALLPGNMDQIITFKMDKGAIEYLDTNGGRVHFDIYRTYINYNKETRIWNSPTILS